jgi:hypothetical protein
VTLLCSYTEREYISKWQKLLALLIAACFKTAEIVAPVVSNSSPEGNIPDDVCVGDSVEGLLMYHHCAVPVYIEN